MTNSILRARAAVLAVAALTTTFMIVSGAPAMAGAQSDCEEAGNTWINESGDCISTRDHGGRVPGGDPTTIPVSRGSGGEVPRCFRDVAGERQQIACANDHGAWNGTCYVQQVTEPPVDRVADFDEAVAGHDDGVVISCYYPQCDTPEDWRNDPDARLMQCPVYNWAPDADPVDPAQIAEEIWARLGKRSIDIGVAPYDDPDHMGYVGVGTWYWTEDPGPETVGPLTDSDSAAGFTVTVDSSLERIEWDLGNGEILDCPPDAMPFEEGKNLGRRYPEGSPDCGYVFQEQGTYTITATSIWIDSWAGLGRIGAREDRLPSETTIRIGENQVLRQ